MVGLKGDIYFAKTLLNMYQVPRNPLDEGPLGPLSATCH